MERLSQKGRATEKARRAAKRAVGKKAKDVPSVADPVDGGLADRR